RATESLPGGYRRQASPVVRHNGRAGSEVCDPRVAGGTPHALHARTLREPPDERVLAAPAPDHQDAHPQCRKCRMPVKIMATPCASAARMTSSSRLLPPGCTTAVAPA